MDPSGKEQEEVVGVVGSGGEEEVEALGLPPDASQVENAGAVVAPGGAAAANDAEELDGTQVGLELGDLIEIHGGKLDGTVGRIYFIDETRISILADGVTHRLEVIELEEDDEGNKVPNPPMDGIEVHEKRLLSAFVGQYDFQIGQKAETFTAEGEALATYTVKAINEQEDTATLVDEAEEELVIPFAFQGIPRDKSVAPFDVIRLTQPPKSDGDANVNAENAPSLTEGEEEEAFEVLLDLELGDVPDTVPVALEGFNIAKAIPMHLRLIDEDEQMDNMLQDLISTLDTGAQRDPRRVRILRRMVENWHLLQNDISSYKRGLRIATLKPASFITLAELLEKTEFPLAKQVLSLARSLYVDHSLEGLQAIQEGGYADPTDSGNPEILLNYLQDVVDNGNRYMDNQFAMGRGTEVLGVTTARRVPRWYTIWQGFFNRFFSSLKPIDAEKELLATRSDRDFFRAQIPKESGPTLSGFKTLGAGDETFVDGSVIEKILFSYMRTITSRVARYGPLKQVQPVEDPDSSEILAHILFPLLFIRDLGYTRSGNFALDVAHGQMNPMTMGMILKANGAITDIPTADKIFSINFDGSSLGNVEIADWLKGQALYGEGQGDIMPYLRSFGMVNPELTLSQKLVLDQKVQIYVGAIKKRLKQLRDEINGERRKKQSLLTSSMLNTTEEYEMFTAVRTEPLLGDALTFFEKSTPSLSLYDLSRFAYLFQQYPDYLLVTLAKNPDVAFERFRATRDLFLKKLRDKLALELKEFNKGAEPRVNPCQHVKDLVKIKKIKDDADRMLMLAKFITLYKSKKQDHWLWCNNGEPHHLLCEHEYLLVQEFLKPREKDIIHKQILLTFSGGVFHGQYICKNCGQPIQRLEFDSNLEFTDTGVPMIGRGVLVDEDAVAQEELEKALLPEYEDKEKVEAFSEEESLIYRTIAEIAMKVGIYPDKHAYTKMIARVKAALATAPDEKKYTLDQKRKKAAGQPTLDYHMFINRMLVCLCASALHIDVQTHVPEYIVRYTLVGCAKPEFIGYPRDKENEMVGIEYMTCAIGSMMQRKSPWDLTGFQSIQPSAKRLKEILYYTNASMRLIGETPDVQQDILDKKQYLLETFGSEAAIGRPKDRIPSGFTPEQIILPKAKALGAEAPVIAESASPFEKSRAWILEAHRLALTTGVYNASNLLAESACCYNPLSKPGGFWQEASMPLLPPKMPPQGPVGSDLYVPMSPRPRLDIFGKSDANIMYRLFLRVCFRGPRKGLQHEPGYDHVCPWCEFTFPEDPRLPPPIQRFSSDAKKQAKFDEDYARELLAKQEKEIAALASAGVEITKESFEDLLNTVNQRSLIPALPEPYLPSNIITWRGLLTVKPVPYEDYLTVMNATMEAIAATPPDADKATIATAFSELSKQAADFESELKRRLGEANYAPLGSMIELSPQELAENLRTYLLIPLQRIYNKMSDVIRLKPRDEHDFSRETKDDIRIFLQNHTGFLNKILKDIPKEDKFVNAKIKELVDKLSEVIPLLSKVLRANILKGGSIGLPDIQKSIVLGAILEFVSPNHLPPDVPGLERPATAVSVPAKMPASILAACLTKFKQEGLSYTSDQIRLMIQDRIEKEKSNILRKYNELDEEGRRLEKMLMRMGMGKWAVGGTKAIWKYDPKQYTKERDDMAEAGITRFGPEPDVYNRGEGFDVAQHHEDDA
jgi:hypothetical protein